MLWALAQPVAVLGLAGGYLVALGLRLVAQRFGAWVLGVDRTRRAMTADPSTDVEPIGLVTAVVAGVSWGRGVQPARGAARGRTALAILAGPVATIGAGQLVLAVFVAAFPADRTALRINRPSDVLHGVIVPTAAAQLMLSVAVALLCFGLLALLPIPPLDGSRLLRLLLVDGPAAPDAMIDLMGSAVLLVLAVTPTSGGVPPLLALLDLVGTPLLRLWA